jgi:pyruvate,water dikinase
VDAFLGDNQNANHVSIRLKGGGAAPWQRALRVEFIAEVLRLHRFTVSITEDILNGWCRGIDQATGSRRLATLGRLLRFSAQLDLWMTDRSQVQRYVAAFIEWETARAGSEGPVAARVH